MKNLPIGIQDFEKLIETDFLYVDKTEQIYNIIAKGSYFFLSRPRRFGKSLTLSTIKEIFQGKKHLFKGLWIENQWDWSKTNPVIHISFSGIGYHTAGLENALHNALQEQASLHNISLTSTGFDSKFRELIQKLANKKGKVVLLIDEYDKPLIDYLDDIPQAKAHQKILKTFYSVIKDADPYIRLLFITGISRFAKVSIFSELNNLDDITRDWRFADLVGYTMTEILAYFGEGIQAVCKRQGKDDATILAEMKEWYNGYSWDGETFVFNPFSMLNFFNKQDFQNFWFATGTPTFLIKLLKERNFYDFERVEVGEESFESYEIESLETLALLFQTGYLTIKSRDEFGLFTLDYPNKEVKDSMLRHLIAAFRHTEASASAPLVVQLRHAFVAHDLDKVAAIFHSLFKSIPYQIFIANKEAYYHSVIHLVLTYLGQYIESEVQVSDGRIDSVVQTATHIYLLEFKLDESKEAAFQQIIEKNYGAKYSHSSKKIMGMGINFSSETKGIEGVKIENL